MTNEERAREIVDELFEQEARTPDDGAALAELIASALVAAEARGAEAGRARAEKAESEKKMPGPWKHVRRELFDNIYRSDWSLVVTASLDADDARLIAAAPQLLAAARQAYAALLEHQLGNVPGGEQAREALLQALIAAGDRRSKG